MNIKSVKNLTGVYTGSLNNKIIINKKRKDRYIILVSEYDTS